MTLSDLKADKSQGQIQRRALSPPESSCEVGRLHCSKGVDVFNL
jgi:hypothetical protein